VIGDFHYNGHLLLTKYPDCAGALAKYRNQSGNVGTKRRDDNFLTIIQVAITEGKAVRIGVNWGSLDQQLLTELMDAKRRARRARDARDVTMDAWSRAHGARRSSPRKAGCRTIGSFYRKVSGVQDLVALYGGSPSARLSRCTSASRKRGSGLRDRRKHGFLGRDGAPANARPLQSRSSHRAADFAVRHLQTDCGTGGDASSRPRSAETGCAILHLLAASRGRGVQRRWLPLRSTVLCDDPLSPEPRIPMRPRCSG